jgi:GDP-L-fucose synthase
MPTNLYGPGDNYDLATSHVLPAIVRKFITAKKQNLEKVVIWGSGEPRREFLHVDDLANACYYLMLYFNDLGPVNIGTGKDISIRELALMVKDISKYKGEICWDKSMPDGTPRKLLDIEKITSLGWNPNISLSEGVHEVCSYFESNFF